MNIPVLATQDPLAMGVNNSFVRKEEEEMSKSVARAVALRNEDWNWSTF